jgi:nucleotide-binding universal stress UspA family protein
MANRVLVPVDGSPLSQRALRHALAQFPDAEVIAYHVSDVFESSRVTEDGVHEPLVGSEEWYAMEQETAEAVLDDAEAIAAESDREVTTESEIGDPQRLVPDYAREEDIDHIVMGVHGREDAERSMVGRVAETVVFRAPVPVTLIR